VASWHTSSDYKKPLIQLIITTELVDDCCCRQDISEVITVWLKLFALPEWLTDNVVLICQCQLWGPCIWFVPRQNQCTFCRDTLRQSFIPTMWVGFLPQHRFPFTFRVGCFGTHLVETELPSGFPTTTVFSFYIGLAVLKFDPWPTCTRGLGTHLVETGLHSKWVSYHYSVFLLHRFEPWPWYTLGR
jgi:hypothetical protein